MTGHNLIDMRKYNRGRAAISGRPQVGYEIVCECGWSTRTNQPKRQAKAYHTDHVLGVKNAVKS